MSNEIDGLKKLRQLLFGKKTPQTKEIEPASVAAPSVCKYVPEKVYLYDYLKDTPDGCMQYYDENGNEKRYFHDRYVEGDDGLRMYFIKEGKFTRTPTGVALSGSPQYISPKPMGYQDFCNYFMEHTYEEKEPVSSQIVGIAIVSAEGRELGSSTEYYTYLKLKYRPRTLNVYDGVVPKGTPINYNFDNNSEQLEFDSPVELIRYLSSKYMKFFDDVNRERHN